MAKRLVDKLGDMAFDSGIVRSATVNVELDNVKIAHAIEGMLGAALSLLPHVQMMGNGKQSIAHLNNDRTSAVIAGMLKPSDGKDVATEDPKSISPHRATLVIRHDLLADGFAKGLGKLLKGINSDLPDNSQFSYKTTPNDDGMQVNAKMDMKVLRQIVTTFSGQGDNTVVDGILDPSDVPENKEQMLKQLSMLMGVDGETGEKILDGQGLLKLLQAYFARNHLKGEKNNIKEMSDEEVFAKTKRFFDMVPGVKLERDGEDVTLDMNARDLALASQAISQGVLSQINGFKVLTDEENDAAFTSRIQVDFQVLTKQALQVAKEVLEKKPGVRINVSDEVTTGKFDTDLRRTDRALVDIKEATARAIASVGGMIAGKAQEQDPDGFVAVVKKHFVKAPEQQRGQM